MPSITCDDRRALVTCELRDPNRAMISLTAQYALRAMVLIAQEESEGPVLASRIARSEKVPRQYLSVILRQAVRSGLLNSTRGRGGGFVLKRPASDISLAQIVSPFDRQTSQGGCPFGMARCSDEHPCPVHDHWKPIVSSYRRMLEQTMLADLIESPTRRRNLTTIRNTRRTARRAKHSGK